MAVTYISYDKAMKNFIEKLTERAIDLSKEKTIDGQPLPETTRLKGLATFTVKKGKKFDKVIRTSWGSSSVYAFIKKDTGGIIKAASFKAPEPKQYERGNIYNDDCLQGTEEYGVVYYS